MAGSYNHCVDEDNGNKFTFDFIENLGDAHEACHMMFHMIRHLAGDDPEKIQEAQDWYYQQQIPYDK